MDHYNRLDQKVRNHIQNLMNAENRTSDVDRELFAKDWIRKETVFLQHAQNLSEVDRIPTGTISPFLVLTVSGSLLGFSPETTDGRSLIYYSTGTRKTVPTQLVSEGVRLHYPVIKGEPLRLVKGPLKETSAVYRIALFADDSDKHPEGGKESVRKKTLMIADDWEKLHHE